MKDVAQILRQNGFIIMSSGAKRISLNKGYTEKDLRTRCIIYSCKDRFHFQVDSRSTKGIWGSMNPDFLD